MINTFFTVASIGFPALAFAQLSDVFDNITLPDIPKGNNTISQIQYDADGDSYKSLFIRAADGDWGADCSGKAFLFVNSDDPQY